MIGAITAGATSAAGGFPIRTGLYSWYDASVASSITSSANKVSQWNDLSGNGLHLTQGTGAFQPSTGTTTQNGRNVIAFDSSNLGSTSHSFTANSLTVFYVAKKTAAGGSANLFSRVISLSLNGGNDYDTTNGMNPMYATNTLGGYSPNSTIYRDSAVVAAQSLTYNAANTTAFTLNGSNVSLMHNSTTATGTTSATALNANRFAVGATYLGGPDGYLNGWVGELLIYKSVLSTTDINLTRDYLKTKWATV
jgi:hypothetical protein